MAKRRPVATAEPVSFRSRLPLPTSWADMINLIVKVGAPTVMVGAAMYWMAWTISEKLDAHVVESHEQLAVSKQQLDVLWMYAASSQRGCINLAKLAKTDPMECTLTLRPK